MAEAMEAWKRAVAHFIVAAVLDGSSIWVAISEQNTVMKHANVWEDAVQK